MRTPIFNDYDSQGYRTTINGCRSSKTADESLVHNLRHRWPTELAEYSDQKLVNEYDEFALSDDFGNNDEKFLDWIASSVS